MAYGIFRCQQGIKAALQHAMNAKTEEERAKWQMNLKRWQSRLANAKAEL